MSQSSSSLCQICRSISLTEMRGPNRDRMQPHQPSYLALKNSASSGCQLCGFIWKALGLCKVVEPVEKKIFEGHIALNHVSERYPGRQISLVAWGQDVDGLLDRILITTTGEIPDVESDDEFASDSADPTMHPDHQISLSGGLDIFAYPGEIFRFPQHIVFKVLNSSDILTGSVEDDPAAWHGEICGRPLPRTAGDSDEDFELAKQWLNDCLCRHDHSQNMIPQETQLPTRVLDIGPADGSEEPYLLETQGIHGYYITLSHCWGGQVPLTTTSDTISERKRCISLPSLPKTFRDAVLISRKLGVRYLWIDSLCIIQDSKEDWENESARMGDVYAHSYLTIAARGAANAGIGCFIPREEELPTCCLEYHNPDSSINGKIYVRDPGFQAERIDASPLDNRGWVFQERILSPRIIYYGSQQLYWECISNTIRQDGKFHDVESDGFRAGSGFKEDWDLDTPKMPKFHNDESEKSIGSKKISVEQLKRMCNWYLLVSQYTHRKLTFASDRLPALAGVAKHFHEKTGYLYVAGLWKEDLMTGLLWYRPNHKDAPTSSKLPTWSWARFNGGVSFWSDERGLLKLINTDCELIDLSYQTNDGFHNYGEVSNAKIQIKGRVLRAILNKPKPGGLSNDMRLYTKDGAIIGRPVFDRENSYKFGFEFFCLLVHQSWISPAGLVLEQVEGQTAEYKRIGYIVIPSRNKIDLDDEDGRTAFANIDPQVFSII